MAVTPNLGLASPLISGVAGWIARLKADLLLIDTAFGGMGALGNLLTNPSFEFNQRAVTSWTGDGVMGVDRWYIITPAGETLTATWDTAHLADPSSSHAAKAVFVKGAGASGKLAQEIEGAARYKGRPLALRVPVWCATPNAVRAFMQDGVGVSYSAFHPGDSQWHDLDVVRTLDAAATQLTVGTVATADSTHWADNATLVHGSVALPYVPLHPSVERALVQRYYEVHIPGAAGGDWPYFQGYASAGGQDLVFQVPWQILKAVGAPTLAISGSGWTGVNTPNTAPVAVSCNDQGYVVKVTSTAAGLVSMRSTAAGGQGYIAGEANPP